MLASHHAKTDFTAGDIYFFSQIFCWFFNELLHEKKKKSFPNGTGGTWEVGRGWSWDVKHDCAEVEKL